MTGGGIGIDYSVYRPEGSGLSKTGGLASGPVPKDADDQRDRAQGREEVAVGLLSMPA